MDQDRNVKTNDAESGRNVAIVFCAAAGQGLQTAEDLVGNFLSEAGYYVFTTREYMSRVRGGNNSTLIRVSNAPVRCAVRRIDWLFALSPNLRPPVLSRIDDHTRILGDAAKVGHEFPGRSLVDLELAKKAQEVGGALYESMIVAGIVAGLFALPATCADELIAKRFTKQDVADKNRQAFKTGHEIGLERASRQSILPIEAKARNRKRTQETLFLDGHTAMGLGALAAGCNFVTAYPMSPGSGLFSFFVKHGHRFDCVVEQTEDEIAAANMAIGASYAGARALVTTSGGGFALMTEALSLAGMTETPLVVHIGQRPGPATGLATRTEQADLQLALYAGHGEFPRVILTPGTLEETFAAAYEAYRIAGKYRTQVIVLTDQYLLDSAYEIVLPDLKELAPLLPLIKTDASYRNYDLKRAAGTGHAVPGHGDGFVNADSHEHTQEGHITEDPATRTAMTSKRLSKIDDLHKEALPPRVLCESQAYDTAIVCWGSTIAPMEEAASWLKCSRAAFVLCTQVYPLSESFSQVLSKAKRVFFVEGNGTGQFQRLVRAELGIEATGSIRKYDGTPFTVEELVQKIKEVL